MNKIPLSIKFLFPIFILFTLFSPARPEISFSILAGPSLSLGQDIKEREFDSSGKIIKRQLLYSKSSLRAKIATKVTWFFHRNFGIESEFFYGQILASLDTNGDTILDTQMKQDRYAFLLSFVLRGHLEKLKGLSYYFGMGAGGFYSDFNFIKNEWDYGGQFFSGINFPSSKKFTLFVETKYIWAPDVGNSDHSPGKHLKISGSPKNNLATHLFGPHYDTQIISLMIGTRFKLRD